MGDVQLESENACLHVRDSKTNAGIRSVWLTKHGRETLLKWHAYLVLPFHPSSSPVHEFLELTLPTTRKPGRRPLKPRGWQTAESMTFVQHSRVAPTLVALQA